MYKCELYHDSISCASFDCFILMLLFRRNTEAASLPLINHDLQTTTDTKEERERERERKREKERET